MVDLHQALTTCLALVVVLVCISVGLYWTAGGTAALFLASLWMTLKA